MRVTSGVSPADRPGSGSTYSTTAAEWAESTVAGRSGPETRFAIGRATAIGTAAAAVAAVRPEAAAVWGRAGVAARPETTVVWGSAGIAVRPETAVMWGRAGVAARPETKAV
jgi:hypothetical protein